MSNSSQYGRHQTSVRVVAIIVLVAVVLTAAPILVALIF
jgi:hypothetical protein